MQKTKTILQEKNLNLTLAKINHHRAVMVQTNYQINQYPSIYLFNK
jgi:thioredoxin-like negative regulator of GroEL